MIGITRTSNVNTPGANMQELLIESEAERRGLDRPVGTRHYRAFVGPTQRYDLMSANQFQVMCRLGLREDHYLLDIGCGSLRAGRLLMAYLLPGRYFGIEPERWVLEEGIRAETGSEFIKLKSPIFDHNSDFDLGVFGRSFDFMLAQSIFTHTPVDQIRKCFANVASSLRPTGLFAATFKQDDHEDYTGDEWIYPHQARYRRDTMRSLAEDAGLCISFPKFDHPGLQTWMILSRAERGPWQEPDAA